jgi:hypothetical protein
LVKQSFEFGGEKIGLRRWGLAENERKERKKGW